MAQMKVIEYDEASPAVRAVYDQIRAARKTDWINNFWKVLANDPVGLARTWRDVQEVMAAGKLDRLTKEMIYVAVSVTNNCTYCINSHTAAARKAGMDDAMLAELIAVVGMANQTNRLANGYQVEVDPEFLAQPAGAPLQQPVAKASKQGGAKSRADKPAKDGKRRTGKNAKKGG